VVDTAEAAKRKSVNMAQSSRARCQGQVANPFNAFVSLQSPRG
jgi:hypothetical protein